MQMKYLDNVLTFSITIITISLVVMFGFFAAFNTQSIIMDKDFKKQIKYLQDEPESQSHKFSISPLVQTALAEHSTEPLSVKIQNITAVSNPINNSTSTIFVAFDIRNHDQNTILLEGLNYNMYYDNHRIVTGSIGSQLVRDIFQSKSEFPIVGNGSLVLKDSQKFEKGSSETDNEAFTNILNGNAHQLVNGTVFYKQISNIQSYGGTQQFEATFPQSVLAN
jgi:hypothetical protein